MRFSFLFSDQKLVPEQADEAEEDGAGRAGSCLSGKRRLSIDALPRAAGLQAGSVPAVSLSPSSRGPGCCLLRPSTQPAVRLHPAQCLQSAPGLFLPVQQPPRSHAALGLDSALELVPAVSSVLLTLSFNQSPMTLLQSSL